MSLETIGSYEIKSEICRSELAVVYRAYDPLQQREVAIKVLDRECIKEPTVRGRYQELLQIIGVLKNPAVVPVYEFGEQNEQVFIVMRYMPGGSLADRLAKSPLSFEEASLVILRLAVALDAAHSVDVAHGDIKPSNVLYDQDGVPYLTDFGMLKFAEASAAGVKGMLFGPSAYLSPEQAGKATPVPSNDQYMLGVLLFEMLFGQLPYISGTPLGYAVQHLHAPIPHLPEASPEFQTFLEKALAKKPEERFQTAAEMSAALGNLREIPVRPVIPPEIQPPGEELFSKITKVSGNAVPRSPVGLATLPGRRKRSWVWAWELAGLMLLLGVVGYGLFIGGQAGYGPLAMLASSTAPLPTEVTLEPPPIQAVGATPTVFALPTETLEPSLTPILPTPVPTLTPIPTPTPIPSPTISPSPSATYPPLPAPSNPTTYKIEYNDTLFGIASKYNVFMNELMGINNLRCNSPLPPGVTLIVPPAYSIFPPVLPPVSLANTTQLGLTTILDCLTNISAIDFSHDGRLVAVASGNFVYIWQVGDWKPLVRLKGHLSAVTAIDFSPDGQLIATGSNDTTIQLWQVSDGKPVQALKGHTNQVTDVVFSPGGQTLVSASRDLTARIWRIDGSQLKQIYGYPAFSVAFSPDALTIAVGYAESVHLYNVSDLKDMATFASPARVVKQLVFSPDGHLLASSSDVWRVTDGKNIYSFDVSGDGVSFSPDGQVLAIGRKFIQISNGRTIYSLRSPVPESEHTNDVWDSAMFSPDGSVFAWGTQDGIFIWRLPEGAEAASFGNAPTYMVQAGDNFYNIADQLKVSPTDLLSQNGLTCSSEYFLGQILIVPGNLLARAALPSNPITPANASKLSELVSLNMKCVHVTDAIAFSSDGQSLVSGSALWRIANGSPVIQTDIYPLNADGSPQKQLPSPLLALSPDGQMVALRAGRNVELWQVKDGRLLRILQGHTGNVTSISWAPDGKFLASGSGTDEQVIRIWNAAEGVQVDTIPGWTILDLDYSPDGQYLISEGDNGLRVWRLSDKRMIFVQQGIEGVVAISPDNRMAAFASCQKRVSTTCVSKLVSIAQIIEGKVAITLQGFTDQIQDLHFSPDGKLLAATSGNGINVWRVSDWKPLQQLRIPMSLIPFRNLYFSPDSSLLVSTGEDNVLRVWQLSDGNQVFSQRGAPVDQITFNANGTLIAVLVNDSIHLWGIR